MWQPSFNIGTIDDVMRLSRVKLAFAFAVTDKMTVACAVTVKLAVNFTVTAKMTVTLAVTV